MQNHDKKRLNPLFGTIVVICATLISQSVMSGLAAADTGFSLENLKGNYGFVGSGSVVDTAIPAPPASEFVVKTPLVRAGIFSFDGTGICQVIGGLTNKGTLGAPANPDAPLACTYDVNSNGTGHLDVNGNRLVYFVIVDHGKALQFIRTDAGIIVSGDAKKQ